MLDAYDGALPHPRSKSAFQNDRGNFVSSDDEGCLYRFNSLGYRSEEFDPAARLKIFVSGCSYTFGLGVRQEQTWPFLLKKRLADRLGVPPDRANLQNFSQIGASNGYIARTIIRQCDRVRPDLAVIAFTHRERSEYLAPGVTRNLGLWDLDIHENGWSIPAARYFDQFNVESASLDLLKNMLLVQWAMVRRGIPYLLLWMNRTGLDEPPIADLAPLRRLREMIDPARLSARRLLEPDIMVDSNPADDHPGPKSHANFASRVLDELDLSAPSPPADDQRGERRVLVLGRSCSASASDDAGCLRSHKLVARAAGPSLAPAASNDGIVRMLLEECRREKPGFVFAGFSDSRSCEHFQGDALVELDPGASTSATPELARLVDAYRQFATDELSELNVLRNILMAQEFLEMQRVPYKLSVPPAFGWQEMTAPGKHPVLRAYASLIKPAALCSRRQDGARGDDAETPRRGATEITLDFVERLKRRLRKSRTEDPNIYPLW